MNASKFALNLGATEDKIVTSAADANVISHPLDQSLLAQLHEAIVPATRAFEKYDYARTLNLVETFFWHFTDDYIELIKDRAYGSRGEAEQASVVAYVGNCTGCVAQTVGSIPAVCDRRGMVLVA